jgi:hypothetical protein
MKKTKHTTMHLLCLSVSPNQGCPLCTKKTLELPQGQQQTQMVALQAFLALKGFHPRVCTSSALSFQVFVPFRLAFHWGYGHKACSHQLTLGLTPNGLLTTVLLPF